MSFFPLLNVLELISIQSYGNSSLHVPTLYTLIFKHAQQVGKGEVFQWHKRLRANTANMMRVNN